MPLDTQNSNPAKNITEAILCVIEAYRNYETPVPTYTLPATYYDHIKAIETLKGAVDKWRAGQKKADTSYVLKSLCEVAAVRVSILPNTDFNFSDQPSVLSLIGKAFDEKPAF